MLISLASCVTGFLLDFLFGDPVWLYHPVRLIGKLISLLEKRLRRGSEKQKEILGGVLWLCVSVLSFTIPVCMFWRQHRRIHPMVRFLLESFWCYQIFAARSLTKESKKVYRCLKEQDLKAARKAVSMIVGRDTENLTKKA